MQYNVCLFATSHTWSTVLHDVLHENLTKYVLPCPLSRCRLVPGSIRFVQMCDIRHQRVLRVGICQHRTNGKKHWQKFENKTITKLGHCIPLEMVNAGDH
jgi:hypothetical protein